MYPKILVNGTALLIKSHFGLVAMHRLFSYCKMLMNIILFKHWTFNLNESNLL